jgi:hypothetical protein
LKSTVPDESLVIQIGNKQEESDHDVDSGNKQNEAKEKSHWKLSKAVWEKDEESRAERSHQ